MEPAPPPQRPTEGTDFRPKDKTAKRKAGERFAVLNTFVDVSMRNLKSVDAAVWLVLYRDTKPDGLVRVSQLGIAKRAGVSDRTVRRSLERLESLGLLTVVCRGSIRRGSSIYRIRGIPK